jgi:hypothetical protein
MHKSMTAFCILLCWVLPTLARTSFEIGTVSIMIEPDRIVLTQADFRYETPLRESMMHYVFIIDSPFFSFSGMDGIPDPDSSPGVKPLPLDRSLEETDFTRFSFFGPEDTCIGLVNGGAGASGLSRQELVFLDTVSNRHAIVETENLQAPKWILDQDAILGFINMKYVRFLGMAGMGGRNRIDACYRFADDGFAHDPDLTSQMCMEEYNKITFTPAELRELSQDDLTKIQNESAVRLLDVIYYAANLGNTAEAINLLDVVNPLFREACPVEMKGP